MEQKPDHQKPSSRAGQAIILMSGLVSAAVVTIALVELQGIIRPFFIAIFLSLLIKPLTSKLSRRVGILGYAVACAILFGAFSIGEAIIRNDFTEFPDRKDKYKENLQGYKEPLNKFFKNRPYLVNLIASEESTPEKSTEDTTDSNADGSSGVVANPATNANSETNTNAKQKVGTNEKSAPKQEAADPKSQGTKKEQGKDTKSADSSDKRMTNESGNQPTTQPTTKPTSQKTTKPKAKPENKSPDEEAWPRIQAKLLGLADPESITSILSRGGSFVFGIFGEMLIVLVMMMLLLLESDRIPGRLASVYGREKADRILEVFSKVSTSVTRYVSLKIWVSLLTSVICVIVMSLSDLHYAITFGIVVFFFNFIPYLGSVIATLFPCLIMLLQSEEGPMPAIWLAISLTAAQQIVGNFIEPRIQGKGLSMSPVIIVLALGFWGWVWGIGGMILAVPITVTIRIVLEQFQTTRQLALMLGSEDA